MLVMFFFLNDASKYLKCHFTCPPAQVQHDELGTRLSFGEMVEFLQAVVFVLCETLMQLVEVKAVKK